ncbi:MAG: 4Fe-4S single cluster domain-containing protein [Nocardioidaceae bacterium]
MTTKPGPQLHIGALTPTTEAEGPGQRFAVWAQGCTIRCSGCFNPHLWGTSGGMEIDPQELAGQAIAQDVEGVTLLGGEPFDQAEAFAVFASAVRTAGLSVMTFTGHYLDALTGIQAPPGAAALLAQTDLLVDGPYMADDPDHARPWVGSRNQGFHLLTDRYAHLTAELSTLSDRLEIRVSAGGDIRINGWADVAVLDELLDGMTPTIGRGHIR